MAILRKQPVLAALTLGALMAIGPGWAADGITLDAAVATAQQRHQARVVRAATAAEAGRKFYVLRLLNEAGKVWTIRIDAATGEEISQ